MPHLEERVAKWSGRSPRIFRPMRTNDCSVTFFRSVPVFGLRLRLRAGPIAL